MARRVLVAATLLLLVAGLVPAHVEASERSSYIVVFKDTVRDPGAAARDHAARHGATVTHVYRHALKGYAASIPESRVAAVRSDARVAAINVDAPVHALDHPGLTVPTGVHRTFAPNNGNLDIDGIDDRRVDVDIAIIDTGIDIDHPDLNVTGGTNCQKGNTYDDGNGHGTHVAGSAAGLDNGNGVVGMAPGARLWAVRVLDNSGSGSWSSVICGVDWVTQNAATIEVANMSLGGSGSDGACGSTGLHKAICSSVNAGVTYAVAAGNSSADANDYVPATYDEVITVSALADFNGLAGGGAAPTCRTDSDDTFANFSNYGADVDIIAPGVCIRSAWKGGGYNTISGTSMASPHVAGAAALYKATNPTAAPSTVQSALTGATNTGWNNSDDRDSTKEGLLDVSSTTLFAPALTGTDAGDGGSTTDPAPTVSITSPTDGSKVSGDAVAINADASDASPGSVVKVDFYLDAESPTSLIASDSDGSDGWSTTWNSNTASEGAHNLLAVATDTANGTGRASISVTVDNQVDPTKTMSATITAGSTVKKGPWYQTPLTVGAWDPAAVAGAAVALDVYNGACGTSNPTLAASGSGTTGTDGTVTFTFKSRTTGDYCAVAAVTKDGYEPASAQATFTTTTT